MFEPVCVEPIRKDFVSGHDFSRAEKSQKDEGFSPCGAISLSLRLRVTFDSSTCQEDITFAAFNNIPATRDLF
jgi:hypothetical protein